MDIRKTRKSPPASKHAHGSSFWKAEGNGGAGGCCGRRSWTKPE